MTACSSIKFKCWLSIVQTAAYPLDLLILQHILFAWLRDVFSAQIQRDLPAQLMEWGLGVTQLLWMAAKSTTCTTERNPGMIRFTNENTNKRDGFPCFQGGAGFRPSTVWPISVEGSWRLRVGCKQTRSTLKRKPAEVALNTTWFRMRLGQPHVAFHGDSLQKEGTTCAC